MITKKLLLLSSILLIIVSCSDDFTDNEPYTEQLEDKGYQTQDDAYDGLIAVYDMLQRQGHGNDWIITAIASDDRWGGFGTADDKVPQDWDGFTNKVNVESNLPTWEDNYKGIFRANYFLENVDRVDWGDKKDLETNYKAVARFLRAFYHFRLARFYGDIIPLDSTINSITGIEASRSPHKVTYKLIANDLKYAVQNLPRTFYNGTDEFGKINKFAAEGMAAKVFLFYTDYYQEDDLAGVIDGDQARKYINDIINNSGYHLLDNFSHLFLAASLDDYAGEDNDEIIWSIRFNDSSKGSGLHEGSHFPNMVALRGANMPPYASGWGAGTVRESLYNLYDENDSRRDATIIDIEKEVPEYDVNDTDQRDYTGYFDKKNAPITNSEGENDVAAGGANQATDNYIDQIVLRYADVLLMGAELNTDVDNGLAQQYLDKVRARAFGDNDHSIEATKENIIKERHLELALEGERYYDIIRQGMDTAKEILDHPSSNTLHNVVFRKETGGFFPIPLSEINASEGEIEQNPGW